MSGPRPKDPALRQRRNKSTTAAVLVQGGVDCPPLSARSWQEQTEAWWADVWASPMARAFLQADQHALQRLALLIDAFWITPTPTLAGEIRQQESRFGLTPLDRWRLQWKIEDDAPLVAKQVETEPDDPRITMLRKKAR